MSTVKITSFFLFLLVVSNIYSLSTVKEEENSFNLKLHGQSSFWVDISQSDDNDYEYGVDFGRLSFELEGKTDNAAFSMITSYTDEFQIEQFDLRYFVVDFYSIRIGYLRTPFGRLMESSDSELLMNNRNPLTSYCNRDSRLGIVNEFSIDENFKFVFGAYNSGVKSEKYKQDGYPLCDISCAVHFMPLGYIDLSESAVNGYDDFKIDISPSYNFVKKDFVYKSHYEAIETDTYIGLQTALRYSALSVDLIYYNKRFNVRIRDNESFKYDAYSAQVSYAFWNKLEPSVRVTKFRDNLDSLYRLSTREYVIDEYNNTTFECSLNYYLKNLNSRVGIYYIKSTNDIVADVTDTDLKDFEEVRLFMEINIDKLF